MKRFNTLHLRFTLGAAILCAAAIAAFGAFVYLSAERSLDKTLDDSLRLNATQAVAAIQYENGQTHFGDAVSENSALARLYDEGLTVRFLDPGGNFVGGFGDYRHLPLPSETMTAAQRKQSIFVTLPDTQNRNTLRLYSEPVFAEERWLGVIQVAQNLTTRRNALDELLRALILGGIALITLAAGGTYIIVTRTHPA